MLPTDPLKAYAHSLGFELVGVCEAVPAPHHLEYSRWISSGFHATMGYLANQAALKEKPQNLLPGAKSIIAVGLNYHQHNPKQPGKPHIAQYALGRDYHKVLRGKLGKLGAWIEREHVGSQCRCCVDSAPIFERDYAHMAGLGWFGKNTMLINSRRGSYFFIGLLLTTAPLEPDSPAEGGCGTCRKCIDACPTGAIVFADGRWQVDSRSCISYLTIEHKGPVDPTKAALIGDWTFGCDVCQEVCPFNEERSSQPLRAEITSEQDFLRHRAWPNLVDLAQIDQESWDGLTQGSSVRRAGLEGLRRNAKANLTKAM